MNHSAPHHETSERPLISLLGAVSDELAELGVFTEQLQATLSPALLRLADDPDCLRDVQMLDLLSQRLHVLSIFFTSLGQAVPPHMTINHNSVLSAVTLSELAWRLQGNQGAQYHHPAGELETF